MVGFICQYLRFNRKTCKLCAQVFIFGSVLALFLTIYRQNIFNSQNHNRQNRKKKHDLSDEIRLDPVLAKQRYEQTDNQRYITISFFATCMGGGVSNKLYELVSLYGIARTLNRIPYADMQIACKTGPLADKFSGMSSLFPQLIEAIEQKSVPLESTTPVDFGRARCCAYEDVTKLFAYNSSRYLVLSGAYFASMKYFINFKSEVLELLSFTKEDLDFTERIANMTFGTDKSHKICVHVRRGDFLQSTYHQYSTEEFTRSAVYYVTNKLISEGHSPMVAIIGDDRLWASRLFVGAQWVKIPPITSRPSTDYALMARYCNTIILTASASTFGFWSAFLSSAEKIYYNKEFSQSDSKSPEIDQFRAEFNIEDVFPPSWIALQQDKKTHVIKELT